MDLSCILLTWNSARYADVCLRSIFLDLDQSGLSFEVFVIDNGSTDATLNILAAIERPELTVIPLGHNTGTTFSRNIGLRMCRGQVIAVLDSDIELRHSHVFTGLTRALLEQPEIGIVSPRLEFPSGRHQMTADVYPTLGRKFRRFLSLRRLEASEASISILKARDVDYTVSAFWMFRRELLQTVGLLDEQIFYAPEDVDYCLRVALQGFRIVYDPNFVATHHAQEISRRRMTSKAFREHLKGLLYFWRKHGFIWGRNKLHARIADARLLRTKPASDGLPNNMTDITTY